MQVALLIATATVAVTDWWSRLTGHHRLETWSKPATTVLVICLALVAYLLTRRLLGAAAA